MPQVPKTTSAPTTTLPEVEQDYIAIAAAMMHKEGKLQPEPINEKPERKRPVTS